MARTHVIAGYFMWSKRGVKDWQNKSLRFPLLGDVDDQGRHVGYKQADPDNIRQTLLQAQAHGIRVMAPIWRGKAVSGWDRTQRRRIEVFREVIAEPEFHNMRWCVFLGNFHFNRQDGRLVPPRRLSFGRTSPTLPYRNFVDSLTTKQDRLGWFDDPSYFRLAGKPAVVIFRGMHFDGIYQQAIDEVRAFHDQKIYLIGMSALWHTPYEQLDSQQIDRIRAFDATTAWSATAGTPSEPKDLQSLADWLAPRVASWRQNVPDLVVRGTADTRVVMAPTITAQYDKSKIKDNPKGHGAIRYARSREDFRAVVRVASDNLDPVGVAPDGDKLVWLQTFNEWPEGTTCEPTELGEGYPYSHPEYQYRYGYEFLEVLRQELSPGLKRHPREAIPISPADGATVDTLTPTFRWDRVDANPPVTHYRLKITADDGTVVVDEVLDKDAPPAESTYTLDQELEPATEYRWQVRVINSWSHPTSDWSPERTFFVG